ncbi:MAG: glycosyltransferase family 1 protein [bacterium]
MKKNLLFDATGLVDGILDGRGNGIFFTSYNILMELVRREEFNIILYCSAKKAFLFKKAKSLDKNLAKIPLAEYSDIDDAVIYWQELKYNNKIQKESKIKRLHIKIVLAFLKLLSKICYDLDLNEQYKEVFKDIDIFFSPYLAVPKEIQGIKHIQQYVLLHDVIPMILPVYNKHWKKYWFYDLYKSINKNDFYFANSEFTKMDFVKHIPKFNPDHITVIPLSTGGKYEVISDKSDLERVRIKYNIPAGKKYLFSLCTLEPRKNLIFAVKNFIKFIKQNNIDDFVFVLGGGHWESFIEKISEEIKDFEDKIIKIGYVENEDMSALYSGAEMFVFPSLYEGFGMPILESMKCGCPVICSNITSMPEVIGDCGIQINPENDADLIKAFEKMYFDKTFRAECIEKGLKRSERFTWEKCVGVMTKEFENNETV